MFEFLPKEVRAELESARMDALRRKTRLRIRVGDAYFPILRFRPNWFSLDVNGIDHLRGLVDVYDGGRQLFQCLIVASEVDGDELICRVKRSTAVAETAPLDYERDANAPIAYLPKF